MNITASLHSIRLWLIRFACLQLFLSLVSLPILLVWGLPISLLSPLGNLLFGPVITLFLFLSSLLFFTELFCIPNSWLITGLEKLTTYWLSCMHADNGNWLIGFAKPSATIMLIIPVITLIIMHTTLKKPLVTTASSLTIFTLVLGLYLKSQLFAPPAVSAIDCPKGQITVLTDKEQIIVIDPGFLGQRNSATSWAQYTFMPRFIQTMGTLTIDYFIVLQPGTMTFQALERLCITMNIKHLYIVVWQGDMSAAGLRSFYSLQQLAHKKGIPITRIGYKSMHIPLSTPNTLTITPLPELLKTQNITYPAIAVTTQIDNKEITIYSAKYAKKAAS